MTSYWTEALLSAALLAMASEAAGVEGDVQEITSLTAELAGRPDDVDLRFRLAQAYAWSDRPDEARKEAESVLARAPSYWDAHVLLARLDAWKRRWEEARARVTLVLRSAPDQKDAQLLLADIALWSGDPAESRNLVRDLLAKEQSSELWFRLAEIEVARLHHLAAYRAAGEALELDPGHEAAKALRRDTKLLQAELAMEIEALPANMIGVSEILSVTVLPRAWLSASLIDEVRHRFGLLNHRLLGEVDWRLAKERTLGVFGGFGAPAHSVPEWTFGGRFISEIWGPIDGAAVYTYDRLPNPANLYRIAILLGVRISDGWHPEAQYELTIWGDPTSTRVMNGGALRLQWEPSDSFRGQISYAYGGEFSSPTAVPTFDALKSHKIALFAEAALSRTWWLKGGLEVELRANTTQVFRFLLALRKWV